MLLIRIIYRNAAERALAVAAYRSCRVLLLYVGYVTFSCFGLFFVCFGYRAAVRCEETSLHSRLTNM